MMTGKGEILSGDHTFKCAKIVISKGEKLFEAQYTLMNEDNVVIGFWFTHSKSLEEIKECLRKVNARYPEGEGPKVFYTDLCCPERTFLREVFPTLQIPNLTNRLVFDGNLISTANIEDNILFVRRF